MCYTTQQRKPISDIEKKYGATAKIAEGLNKSDLTAHHFNGFAHPTMLILPQENPKYLAPLMWGLIPSWESGREYQTYYNDSIKYGSGLNATTEKLFSSNMFKNSAMARRCIVPVTGFFEPHTTPVKVKGRPFKVPFFFERKNKDIMNLAGIYEFTNDGIATFTILTQPATPLFEKIHNTKKRRPVILYDEDVQGWLDKSCTKSDIREFINKTVSEEDFNAYPVSKDIYNPKVDANRDDIIDLVHYNEIAINYEGKPPTTLFD